MVVDELGGGRGGRWSWSSVVVVVGRRARSRRRWSTELPGGTEVPVAGFDAMTTSGRCWVDGSDGDVAHDESGIAEGVAGLSWVWPISERNDARWPDPTRR